MPYPFDREFMQLALIAGLAMGASAPLIGVFLVQRRLSLLGDGIGHLAFAGVAAGVLADVWPVWSALVVAVVGALVIELLRGRNLASGDLAVAICFYGGIAAGVVLAGLNHALDANLLSYLFGSLLTVDHGDVALVVTVGVAVAVAVGALGAALFAVALDEEWSRVAGLPVGALNALLAVLTAVTIVAAMRVVGLLLVSALMVVPVAGAQVVARSQRGIVGWAVVIGSGSVVAGLAAARVWGLAPGGTIVLAAVGVFAALAVATRVPAIPR